MDLYSELTRSVPLTTESLKWSWVEQGLTSHQTHYRSYRARGVAKNFIWGRGINFNWGAQWYDLSWVTGEEMPYKHFLGRLISFWGWVYIPIYTPVATLLYRGRVFTLQVKWPNQQCHGTEGRWVLRTRLQSHQAHPTVLTTDWDK